MDVRNVVRLLDFVHFLLNTREFTQVRNPTNVRNVRRPFDSIHTLLNIRKFIMEFNARKLSNLKYVTEHQKIKF